MNSLLIFVLNISFNALKNDLKFVYKDDNDGILKCLSSAL